MEPPQLDDIIKEALQQARGWQDRANEKMTSEERVIQKQVSANQ